MKKKLNVDRIQSELSGGSAFFPGYQGVDSPTEKREQPARASTPPLPTPVETARQPGHDSDTRLNAADPTATPPVGVPEQPAARDITEASTLARKHESLHASKHASTLAVPQDLIEAVRKVVKNPGKAEVLYVRLSKEEKDLLTDVSFAFKRQGMKTSDTEIGRIALNVLLEDYQANGTESVLARILESLHA